MKAYSNEPIYLAVDQKRLLKELPYFFKSFEDCIAELIQNAYRASASEIRITLNTATRELEVVDNGKGAPDPLPLVTAGMTGWDESVVTDPAGLGLFSLLGLSEEVTVESRAEGYKGWKINITEECFNGKPISAVLSEYYEGPTPCGVRITAKIKDRANLNLSVAGSTLRTFRHLFPLNVILTSINHKEEEITKEYPAPILDTAYIDSVAGKFYLSPFHKHFFNTLTREPEIVWEHRAMSGEGFNRDLANALCKYPDGTYVASLLTHRYVWVVDPDTGVRPKLPDRRELVHDENYHKAVEALARSIYSAFGMENIKQKIKSLNLPKVIPQRSQTLELQTLRAELHDIFGYDYDIILQLAGYRLCSYEDYHTFYFQLQGDETYSNIDSVEYYVKNPLLIGDAGIAQALCRSGVFALARGDVDTKVRITNPQLAPLHNTCFGVCDSIEVLVEGEVITTLPYLCDIDDIEKENISPEGLLHYKEESPPFLDGFFIVANCSLHEFITDIQEDTNLFLAWLKVALHDNGWIGEYVTDWEDGIVDDEELYNEVVSQIYATHFPSLTADHALYTKMCRLSSSLIGAQCGTQNLDWTVQKLIETYPELKEKLTPIVQAIAALVEIKLDPEEWKVECPNIKCS